MIRIAVVVLFLLFVWGCEGRRQALPHAGPNSAYAAERADSLTSTRRMWAGPAVQLLVSVTPDGKQIVFSDPASMNIAVRDVATDAVQLVTHANDGASYGAFPRVSPDGRRVAFEWWDNASRSFRLMVAPLDGSRDTVLLASSLEIQPEDWSPDGSAILALRTNADRTRQIVLVPLDGTAIRVMKTFDWRAPRRMFFSPDGRYIAYDFPADDKTGQRDVFVLDLNAGRETALVRNPADDYLLGWAPDNQYVLFMSDRTGTPGAWKVSVAGGRAAGDAQMERPEMWRTLPVGFTTDGSYWYGVLTSNRDVFVTSLDASGKPTGTPLSAMHRALGAAEFPTWSRDGQNLAYVVHSPPPLDALAVGLPSARVVIAVRSAATGEVRELPLPIALEYPRPQWAADGSALIVLARENGRSGFYRVDAQTGQTALLFRALGAVTEFQVNPDGRSLTYKSSRASASDGELRTIVVRNLESGTERELYGRSPKAGAFWSLAVSPDGATVAFAQGKDIVLLPTDSGPARTLPNIQASQPGSIAWSADGRWLYVATPLPDDPKSGTPSHEIVRVAIADGHSQAMGVAGDGLVRLSLDPRGRWMAHVSGRSHGEIWKMERTPSGPARAK
jgi:Tol biopolymer transport system component